MEEYTITNLKGDDSFIMNENKGQSQCWKVTRGSDSWVVKRTMDKTIACYEEIMVNRYSTFLNVLIEYGMPSSQSENNSKRSIIDAVAEHCKVCDNFFVYRFLDNYHTLNMCSNDSPMYIDCKRIGIYTILKHFIVQTLLGLQKLHKENYVHCDLDRENIMYRLYPCTTAENKQRYRLHFVIIDFSSIRKDGSQEQTYSHSEEREIHLLSDDYKDLEKIVKTILQDYDAMKRKEDNEDSEELISYDKLEYNEYDNEEFNKLASLLEVLHTKKNNENCIDELLNNEEIREIADQYKQFVRDHENGFVKCQIEDSLSRLQQLYFTGESHFPSFEVQS